MNKLLIVGLVGLLAGCSVRTAQVTTERLEQKENPKPGVVCNQDGKYAYRGDSGYIFGDWGFETKEEAVDWYLSCQIQKHKEVRPNQWKECK